MESVGRRTFLKGCAGAAIATVGLGKSAAAGANDPIEGIRTEQGEYLRIHALERVRLYETMTEIFDPPEREDYEAAFVESLVPSAASLFPGIAGDAAELAETLEWYFDILDANAFRDVSELGVVTELGQDTGRGAFGRGMENAHEELETLESRAAAVQEAAAEYAVDPTESRKADVLDALEAEGDALRSIEWVSEWANIEPEFYDRDNWIGDLPEAAETVRENASVAVDVLEAADTTVTKHLETLESDGFLAFPEMVAVYNESMAEVRANTPSVIFNRFAGDTIHIRVQDSLGEEQFVNWVNTDASGRITEYRLTEQDESDADLTVSNAVIEDVQTAEDPFAAAGDAYERGDIRIQGNGVRNRIKYGASGAVSSIIDRLPF